MIEAGMHAVPQGHLPAVVTYLEMAAPAMHAAKPFPDGMTATQENPKTDAYRALFRAVGEPWLWSSRLEMDDATLAEILNRYTTEVWVVRKNGDAIAMVELDFQDGKVCELAYFGMISAVTGKGLGGPMMALAQRQAFARDVTRFFVHTCNWDDPRALAFYQKAGFSPYKYEVEVFPDPRLQGMHPKTAAPQIPCLT